MYDEEDLKMQKLLIEEFPKKCKEENRFVRLTKYEYSFGDEKINVIYKDGEVILKLDEGDYKLQEFIDILNEGKNEENNFDNENENFNNNEKMIKEKINEKEEVKEEIIDEKLNSEQNELNEIDKNYDSGKKENTQEKLNNSSSSEKKYKKRRKKRVSEDSSFEKENTEKKENKKDEKREIIIDKEMENTFNSDISDAIKISNTEGNESDINSENKGRKYVIKRRRDYKEKKLK